MSQASHQLQPELPWPEASAALRTIAAKLFWWKPVDEALADPVRFVCQILVLGTWDDVMTARHELGEEWFRRALRDAPPGVFDARSWNYWHLVYDLRPVPPLPVRRFE